MKTLYECHKARDMRALAAVRAFKLNAV